ncbi:pilus assembly protein TadG-related protein [Burkholderia cepacia]|uniref:pilus assembly protein TadG-related protein n=1 Tax=Burkholderia cepacia TaxID=292 RepID=UPI00264D22C9|nr:pilus assembly protein TadG-related protein [Burkholderia cepacia]MDN7615165.1 pilus assembly protein TadG-related protein [Burkholderia cepacia]
MPTAQSLVARRRRIGRAGERRQRGGAAIMATIFLAIAVIVLGATDIGRYYAERRHMQAAADAAALSAATQVANDADCTAATTAANQIMNMPASLLSGKASAAVTCGIWSAPQTSGGSAQFTRTSGAPLPANNQCAGLSGGVVSNGQSVNAVCVTVSEPVTGLFINGVTISASAIAKSLPTDSFTLLTSLATLQGGLVNQLLTTLTNSRNPLTLSVADYQGLAQVNLNMAGIIANLPVGSSTSVLSGTVTLGQLLNAELQAATQQSVAAANLTVLSTIVAAICPNSQNCGGPSVSLGNLVQTAVSSGTSAVNASVNALGLLTTALQVANSTTPISIPSIQVQTPTALAPLLNATVQGSVSLAGNQPAMASGPPGPSACSTTDCMTHATASQGTIFLNTIVSLLTTCSDGSLTYGNNSCATGSPTSVLKAQLPITVYVAPATAGLQKIVCTGSQKVAYINVQTGALAAYLGGSSSAPANINLSVPPSSPIYAPDGNGTVPLLTVNLQSLLNLLSGQPSLAGQTSLTSILGNQLGSGGLVSQLVSLLVPNITVTIGLKSGQLSLPVANQSVQTLKFTSTDSPPDIQGPIPTTQFLAPAVQGIANSGLTLSLQVSGGITAPLLSLLNLLGLNVNAILSQLLSTLTGPLLTALGNTLVPLLLQPVDSILTSVTGVLGLGLGNAYVANAPLAIKCGDPVLVR